MIQGKLENWHKEHSLHFRTQLATGTTPENVKFQVSLNCDNKAIFVEFPDGWTVSYNLSDLVIQADEIYKHREEIEKRKEARKG